MGIDAPEFLAELGMGKYATEMLKVVGDFAVLQVGEYTVKTQINKTKQTVQFKL